MTDKFDGIEVYDIIKDVGVPISAYGITYALIDDTADEDTFSAVQTSVVRDLARLMNKGLIKMHVSAAGHIMLYEVA